MLKSIIRSVSQCQKRSNHLPVPLAALMVMVSVSGGNANANLTSSTGVAATVKPDRVVEAKLVSPSQTSVPRVKTTASAKQLTDGVYLYGQSSVAEQIGREYMVFEVRDGRAIGAFYMPQSEFSCFQGTLQGEQLNVRLAPSASDEIAQAGPQERQEFQPIAARSTSGGAGNSFDAVSFPLSVKLQSYHRIARVSANDQRILGMCKVNH